MGMGAQWRMVQGRLGETGIHMLKGGRKGGKFWANWDASEEFAHLDQLPVSQPHRKKSLGAAAHPGHPHAPGAPTTSHSKPSPAQLTPAHPPMCSPSLDAPGSALPGPGPKFSYRFWMLAVRRSYSRKVVKWSAAAVEAQAQGWGQASRYGSRYEVLVQPEVLCSGGQEGREGYSSGPVAWQVREQGRGEGTACEALLKLARKPAGSQLEATWKPAGGLTLPSHERSAGDLLAAAGPLPCLLASPPPAPCNSKNLLCVQTSPPLTPPSPPGPHHHLQCAAP